jgi:thiol-disulfide isomerase/thioredoxin
VCSANLALVAFSAAFLVASGKGQQQSYGQPSTPRVVAYVQMALQQGDLDSASALVAQYRRIYGDTPEALEALSWVARGELAAGRIEEASKQVEEIQRGCETALATRKLDAEPHLPLALGAAYELEAEILSKQHQRAEAVQLLASALRKWRGTSIADRLQKNLNLMTLEGKPVPLLQEPEWIGPKPATMAALRGKVVLLFFWAHWCADCKAEAPIIAQLASEFSGRGLVVIAPTRRYGYTADDEHADAAKETAFIDRVYAQYYSMIPNAGVPLDERNFERFGVSTTPTIVLVNKRGMVKLYHPGVMEEAPLRAMIERLLSAQTTTRASR